MAFDTADGKLHDCKSKSLDFVTRKLIQGAVDRMNHTNTSRKEEIVHNIDTILESLKGVR